MAFTTYKEGQGIWARGVMASIVFLVAIMGSFSLYNFLKFSDWMPDSRTVLPVVGWTLDLCLLPVGVVLVVSLAFGVWAYNHPRFVDFLCETENELRTRVTWPARKELLNASAVVVVTTVLIAVWVLLSDVVFVQVLRHGIYRLMADGA